MGLQIGMLGFLVTFIDIHDIRFGLYEGSLLLVFYHAHHLMHSLH